MGKQQTKKSKRQAELRQNVRGLRGSGTRFVVRGKTFMLAGHATAADIADHLRGSGYMRGAEVKWKGSTYALSEDAVGDPALIRL